MISERLIYIDLYTDEIIPCDATVEGWAEWLSKPDEAWNRDAPTEDGEIFAVSVLRLETDIVATPDACGWVLDHIPANPDFLAVRFGPGLGWQADDIVYGEDMIAALREHLLECCEPETGPVHVAVGFNESDLRAVYRAGPPPTLNLETVQ